MFVEEFGDTRNQIEKAIREGDVNNSVKMLHTLKGASGNVGADGLCRASAELESAIVSNGLPAPAEQEIFAHEFEQVIDSMLQILSPEHGARFSTFKPAAMQEEPVGSILETLHSDLEACNYISDETMDRFDEAMADLIDEEMLKRFRAEVTAFSYEQAMVLLKDITAVYRGIEATD
jgi:HPt (histidine-containing phosphotransfer) domain-containing protein